MIKEKWNEKYEYPKDVLEQADIFTKSYDKYIESVKIFAKKTKNFKRIYTVGSGDCFYTGEMASRAFFEDAKINSRNYEAYDFMENNPIIDEETIVFLFSSSGKSLYVNESAKKAKKNGALAVSVTNHNETPLHKLVDYSFVTSETGISKSFPTKTTTSALLLYYMMVLEFGLIRETITEDNYDRLSSELKNDLGLQVKKILNSSINFMSENVMNFLSSRIYTVVGTGHLDGVAKVGAAKFIESSQQVANKCNAEEYMHLYGFSVKSVDTVVVLANRNVHREQQVVEYALDQRANVVVIGDIEKKFDDGKFFDIKIDSDISRYNFNILSIIALQVIAGSISAQLNSDPDIVHTVDLAKVIDRLYTGPVAGWRV